MEESQVSNVFYPRNLLVDNAAQRLEITGDRKQFAEDQLIDMAMKTFEIRYRLENGLFYLLSFLEKHS